MKFSLKWLLLIAFPLTAFGSNLPQTNAHPASQSAVQQGPSMSFSAKKNRKHRVKKHRKHHKHHRAGRKSRHHRKHG